MSSSWFQNRIRTATDRIAELSAVRVRYLFGGLGAGIEILAIPQKIADAELAATIRVESQTFTFTASDLVRDGNVVTPSPHDEIVYNGNKYTILERGAGTCYDYVDSSRERVTVFTDKVSINDVGYNQ